MNEDEVFVSNLHSLRLVYNICIDAKGKGLLQPEDKELGKSQRVAIKRIKKVLDDAETRQKVRGDQKLRFLLRENKEGWVDK